MPAAVAVPIATAVIGGGTALASAKINSNSAKNAAAAQQHAADQALAYQRERQAIEDQRYNQKWNIYQDYVADWKKRNGVGDSSGAAPSSLGVVKAGNIGDLGGGAAPMPAAPGGVAPMGAPGPAMAGPQGQAQPTLADLSTWNDWKNYGAA